MIRKIITKIRPAAPAIRPSRRASCPSEAPITVVETALNLSGSEPACTSRAIRSASDRETPVISLELLIETSMPSGNWL